MKIAVSATNESLDAQIDPRFGRCPYFVIVESETMKFETIPNLSQNAPSGAGIQAAKTIASKGAKVILTGNVGPNAFQVLSASGIKIVTGTFGTVKEAVEKFKSGQLQGTNAPSTQMGFGMGGGYGMGIERGGRRGMGFRRWQGTGLFPQAPMNIPMLPMLSQMPKEQEIQMLENQMKSMQKELNRIKKRLKELQDNRKGLEETIEKEKAK